MDNTRAAYLKSLERWNGITWIDHVTPSLVYEPEPETCMCRRCQVVVATYTCWAKDDTYNQFCANCVIALLTDVRTH